MLEREVKNLQTNLQVPEFAETTARGQISSAKIRAGEGESQKWKNQLENLRVSQK